MASGSASALPLPADLLAVLAKLGVKTAGHVFGVFGEAGSGYEEGSKVLSQFEVPAAIDPDLWELWVLELLSFLGSCEERDRRDAARIFRRDDAEWALVLLRRRRQEAEDPPPQPGLHAGLAALVGAPPPAKRWRTGRVVRREGAD